MQLIILFPYFELYKRNIYCHEIKKMKIMGQRIHVFIYVFLIIYFIFLSQFLKANKFLFVLKCCLYMFCLFQKQILFRHYDFFLQKISAFTGFWCLLFQLLIECLFCCCYEQFKFDCLNLFKKFVAQFHVYWLQF